MTVEETISDLIRHQSKADVQNAFMRLTDKEVAVSLKKLDEETQSIVLNLLPEAKTERIREEMRLFSRRITVPEEKYQQIISHVIAVLQGRSRGNVSHHIRPKKG